MKKKLAILMACVMSFGMLGGCSGNSTDTASKSDSSGDVIKIGVFMPLTGANAAGGELEIEGIKLANELYPEVLGKKVELVIVDNKSDKQEAANAVTRLIEKDKVPAIIGTYGSSLAMAAGNVVKEAKIPTIGTSCTNPQVTLNNPYYFRVAFIDPFQGKVMAHYAYENLGARKVALVQEISNDYSVGLVKFFTEEFKALTGDENCIVETGNYQTGDTDFSAILTSIKGKNPDAIFAPGNYTESAMLIKQARDLGMDVPFMGCDTWEVNEFIEIGASAVEGAVLSTFFSEEYAITKEGEKFLEEYAKRYPDKPAAALTALGYDAYILMIDAIERAGSTDSDAIRDAIAVTENFEGAAGNVTLDENGDAVKDAIIKVVKDGEFRYLDFISFAK